MTHLIIGYGNTLRNDDGAGQRVAEIVAEWDWPEVRSLACVQLTPELAAEMATATTVIFVDAVAVEPQTTVAVDVQPLVMAADQWDQPIKWGHHGDPRSLLCLTYQLYQASPIAYWLLIPGINFELGEVFSETTKAGIQVALERIKQILTQRGDGLE